MKMKDSHVSKFLIIIFLGALGFIFAPVFMGSVSVHDEMDVAIPETRHILSRPGLSQFQNDDTGGTCKEVSR